MIVIVVVVLLLLIVYNNGLYINRISNRISNNHKNYHNNHYNYHNSYMIMYSNRDNDIKSISSSPSTSSLSSLPSLPSLPLTSPSSQSSQSSLNPLESISISSSLPSSLSNIIIRSSSAVLLSISLYAISISSIINPIENANAINMMKAAPISVTDYREVLGIQSPGWELARQKRTLAIKAMVDKGMIKVDTDDSGNQFLKLPWIPDKKVPYKSLSLTQRLLNEVCAGAFGELAKDLILHPVDTAKTRKQAKKKSNEEEDEPKDQAGFNIKDYYAGFPVVLASSIPQGGTFFFIKKSVIEAFNYFAPGSPEFISSTVPIGLAVMGYWSFRTPAEVIKTQVQTGQSPDVIDSIDMAKAKNSNGLLGLWKHYPVMLFLDIPFQIINFILYGVVSNAVLEAGYETSILTRLFCGITCGMIAAAATCPVDVCKTRILARDKERQNKATTVVQLDTSAQEVQMLMINDPTAGNVATLVKPVDSLVKADNITNSVIAGNQNDNDNDVLIELVKIAKEEGVGSLFLGIRQRLLYTGLANGIRLAAYGTSRMDLMMRSLDDL